MVDMVLIGLLLSLFVLYLSGLLVESEIHNRRLRAVPFRISVTGTRGKTTVVRMVAGILREAGYTVLAKTTGTEAKYILPDGSEEPIKRIGLPNILEQKKLIKKAAELKVDYLVTEIMSIHPENHYAETHKLIKPHFTIITNFRQDHLDEVTQEHDMDSMYLNDVYPGSRVILHPEGKEKWRMRFLNKLNIKHIAPEVDPGLSDNKLLANSFGESMDIAPETIKEGIEKAKMDRGSTRIYKIEHSKGSVFFISCFAVNDPLSTDIIRSLINSDLKLNNPNIIGLLSLRMDRGERSRQWLEYLKNNGKDDYDRLYYLGRHGAVFQRELGRGELMKTKDPVKITDSILQDCDGPSIVYGLVNIHGPGLELISHWESIATEVKEFNDYQQI